MVMFGGMYDMIGYFNDYYICTKGLNSYQGVKQLPRC